MRTEKDSDETGSCVTNLNNTCELLSVLGNVTKDF